MAPTLRATLAAEGQLKAHRDRAQDAQRALLVAADFAAEARRLGLTVREAGPLRRGDPVEGVGRVAEASDAVFALAPRRREQPRPRARGIRHLPARRHRAARLLPLDEVAPGRAPRGPPPEGARRGEGPGREARGGGPEGRGPAGARAPGRRDLRRGGAVFPGRAARRPGPRAGAGPRRARARRGRRRRAGRGPRRVLRGEAPRRASGRIRPASQPARADARGAARFARSGRASGRRGSPRPARARRSRSTASSCPSS